MTSPSDQPGIAPETDVPSTPDPRPISTPQPMPEEAPGYEAPTPIIDPPSNPDTPGLPGGESVPGISEPAPMTM